MNHLIEMAKAIVKGERLYAYLTYPCVVEVHRLEFTGWKKVLTFPNINGIPGEAETAVAFGAAVVTYDTMPFFAKLNCNRQASLL